MTEPVFPLRTRRAGSPLSLLFRCSTLGLLIPLLSCALARFVAILYPLPWWVHDPLIYFPTLFYAVPGLAIALIAYRQEFISSWLLLTAVLVLGANVLADVQPPRRLPSATATEHSVELLSYNIFQARWADRSVVALVCQRRPDVLLLQEVPDEFFQTHEAELRQTFRHVVYHKHLLAATNLDVLETESIDLSHGRSLLRLSLDVQGSRFDVFNTHLSVASTRTFFPRLREQQRQTEEVLGRLEKSPGPVVIAGDFNFPLHSTCYRRFATAYRNARSDVGTGFGYTFNTWLPVTTIDHCFASPSVQFLSCSTLPVWLSDHRPVQTRFVIP